MKLLLPLFAPLALLLPGIAGSELARAQEAQARLGAAPDGRGATVPVIYLPYLPVSQSQVSIEQRVTIRVAPRAPTMPVMLEGLPANGAGPRFAERKMGKCVPASGIVGVQYRDASRLVLYLRDRRMISATLEKSCSARDFYSGFYVARSNDGQLCVDRDQLRSRSGANCQISAMRQLVEADN